MQITLTGAERVAFLDEATGALESPLDGVDLARSTVYLLAKSSHEPMAVIRPVSKTQGKRPPKKAAPDCAAKELATAKPKLASKPKEVTPQPPDATEPAPALMVRSVRDKVPVSTLSSSGKDLVVRLWREQRNSSDAELAETFTKKTGIKVSPYTVGALRPADLPARD